MIREIDICRAAHQYIKQHGDNAMLEAVVRADELRRERNPVGQQVFMRIIRAIDWLEFYTGNATADRYGLT